jgi:hypothetical protein
LTPGETINLAPLLKGVTRKKNPAVVNESDLPARVKGAELVRILRTEEESRDVHNDMKYEGKVKSEIKIKKGKETKGKEMLTMTELRNALYTKLSEEYGINDISSGCDPSPPKPKLSFRKLPSSEEERRYYGKGWSAVTDDIKSQWDTEFHLQLGNDEWIRDLPPTQRQGGAARDRNWGKARLTEAQIKWLNDASATLDFDFPQERKFLKQVDINLLVGQMREAFKSQISLAMNKAKITYRLKVIYQKRYHAVDTADESTEFTAQVTQTEDGDDEMSMEGGDEMSMEGESTTENNEGKGIGDVGGKRPAPVYRVHKDDLIVDMNEDTGASQALDGRFLKKWVRIEEE